MTSIEVNPTDWQRASEQNAKRVYGRTSLKRTLKEAKVGAPRAHRIRPRQNRDRKCAGDVRAPEHRVVRIAALTNEVDERAANATPRRGVDHHTNDGHSSRRRWGRNRQTRRRKAGREREGIRTRLAAFAVPD